MIFAGFLTLGGVVALQEQVLDTELKLRTEGYIPSSECRLGNSQVEEEDETITIEGDELND